MKYLSCLGIASVALIATSCASHTYTSGMPSTPQYNDATDFNGEWQLVNGRSDNGRSWSDERSRFQSEDRGMTDGSTRMQYRAWFLPDVFRVDGGRDMLRIEDLNGGTIAEIPLEADNRYGSSDPYGSYNDRDYNNDVRARWLGDRRFEVDRQGRNGGRITQTFTLQSRGRQLVVNTVVDRQGTTRSFTRVYERA